MPAQGVHVVVFSTAALFRDGLCSMLEQSGAVEWVSGVGDWMSLLAQLQQGDVDAVIIDRDGREATSDVDHLFQLAPRIRIVLLSSQDNRLTILMQSPADESYQPQLIAAVARAAPVH
jgi:DNA-binding NarL/FixJ family response regulator